jgi:hypothetical protein
MVGSGRRGGGQDISKASPVLDPSRRAVEIGAGSPRSGRYWVKRTVLLLPPAHQSHMRPGDLNWPALGLATDRRNTRRRCTIIAAWLTAPRLP